MEEVNTETNPVLQKYFPNEVISQLLSRLPIKSLVRFQCVSKPWRALICDIKFNLQCNRQRVLIYRQQIDQNRITFHSINNSYYKGDSITLDVGYLPFPLGDRLKNISRFDNETTTPMLLGSCNGLILFGLESLMYLWNPATRACKQVFEWDWRKEEAGFSASGLCFDEISGKYKAVLGLHVPRYPGFDYSQSKRLSVRFATLGKDTGWTKVNVDYDFGGRQGVGTVVGGRLHWLVRERGSVVPPPNWDSIVYFDPGTNQFEKLEMPDMEQIHGVAVKHSVLIKEIAIRSLSIYDGCLCLSVRHMQEDLQNSFTKVLVMKEYGKKESWTPIMNIPIVSRIGQFPRRIMVPILRLCDDDEVLVSDSGTLYSYNLKTRAFYMFEYFKMPGFYQSLELVPYVATLAEVEGKPLRIA